MLLPPKGPSSEYAAIEWSQIKDEIQAFIQGSGITLSASVLTQMRETVMRNATAGQGCVAGGTANAITLTTRAPFVAGKPSVYQADATYSVLITTTNTGVVTVNINNIGAIPLKKNGYADELDAGDIAVPALYDFVIKADLSAVELVAKKLVFEGLSGSAAPWTTEVDKIANYTILPADAGKLIYLDNDVLVITNITFTVDPTFPDDGVFFTYNKTVDKYVGGGASGEVVKLYIVSGANSYTTYEGNGIRRWTKSALTGKLEEGNG